MPNPIIRVRDLKDLFGMPSPRPMLFCEDCGTESSAHRGDYFMAKPDSPLECCGQPMRLVRKETRYVDAD